MTIYQVLNEQNTPIDEFYEVELALKNAENLTLWHEDHYYHVEAIELV